MKVVTDLLRKLTRVLWEPSLGVALVVGVGVRLVLIPWFSDPFNFWAGFLTAKILSTGQNPFSLFAADPRFQQLSPWPYPAEYFLFALGAFVGSDGIPTLYGILARIPNVLADLGTTVLLFRISTVLGASPHTSRTCALAYLFNPFVIIVSAIWGTNDPIPVFFSVLALHFFLQKTDRGLTWGSYALGLGIAVKLFPILFIPLTLGLVPGLVKKVKVLGIAAIAPFVTSLPFLIGSAPEYVGVVFGFAGGTSGFNRAQLDPQFTIWRVISWFAGPLDASLTFAAAGGLVLGLYWTYRRIRNQQLGFVAAHGLVIFLAYLLAVRWSPSYFSWAVPFVTLHAVRPATGLRKWIMTAFWAPALAYALIYNGWFADPYSGGSGLSYWAHVSGSPTTRVFDGLPAGLVPGLILATVAAALFVTFLFLRPSWLSGRERPSARARAEDVPSRIQDRRWSPLIASVLSLLFVAVFLASVAYQSSNARPVGPTDFGDFAMSADGTASFADSFRGDILSFRWVFRGTGLYSLHPNGTSGILLDTFVPKGTAYLENSVLADRVSTRLIFRIEALYGIQPLVILRTNSSSVRVSGASGGGWMLAFFDAARNRSVDLGPVGFGWYSVKVTSSSTGGSVEAIGTSLALPPTGTIRSIDIGQTESFPNGGGRFVVSEVALVWFSAQRAIVPASAALVVGLDVLVLVSPLLVDRPSKRLLETSSESYE